MIIYIVGGVCRIPAQLGRRRVLRRCRCRFFGRRAADGRRVGVGLRTARRALPLRPDERQQPDPADGAVDHACRFCSSWACSCPASTTTRTSAGFVGGYLTSAFFNPLTRERGDHTDRRALLLPRRRRSLAADRRVDRRDSRSHAESRARPLVKPALRLKPRSDCLLERRALRR